MPTNQEKRRRLNDIMFGLKGKKKEQLQVEMKEACQLMVDLDILEARDQDNLSKAFDVYEAYVKEQLLADIAKNKQKQ